MRSWRVGLIVVVLLGIAAGWVGYRSWDDARFRAALDEAEKAIFRGQYDLARARLARVSTAWPGRGEVDDLLGRSEAAAGRPDAALAAWTRVPSDSPVAARVALRRAALERARGRFGDAERDLIAAARATGPERNKARTQLAEVLFAEGRNVEALELIEANWRAMTREPDDTARPFEAIDMLLTHVGWGVLAAQTEERRAILARAATLAPDDDRVWLARANLATFDGQFDAADALLAACLDRRPDDPAVWRARLDWSVSAGRVDQARLALFHLVAADLAPGRVSTLRAWFAARRGDAVAERRALEGVVTDNPADVAALERLAELALQAGQVARAGRLRGRKAELDAAVHRYRSLYVAMKDRDGRDLANALTRHAPEMARLAATLGRRFEARGFLTLTLRLNPDDREAASNLARLGPDEPTRAGPSHPRRRLSDLLKDDLARLNRSGPATSPRVAAPEFRDDAKAARLEFRFESGLTEDRLLPATMGGGVGLLDYDGDGWLDVYCVQGGTFPPGPSASREGDRLFRNRGDGTFEDATGRSGIAGMNRGYGHGVAVGDIDDDGRPDLFVTRWRGYALYRNRGDGTFEDATDRAGLAGDRDWPTSAAFADLDDDGDLDLYVCHYLAFDSDHPRICRSLKFDRPSTCSPLEFEARPDHVFRNDGGRFVDVTAAAGIVDRDGRGLGVVAADLDDDGRVDLYVANDNSANFLFHNLGGFRFEEVGSLAGAAANARGGYQAGMGLAVGDLDGDGLADLAATNFHGESTTFYQNLGGGWFADRTDAIGLALPSRNLLGFGVAMLDVDNDGRLDLVSANGHIDDFRPDNPYAMPLQLLVGTGAGRLSDVSAKSGPPFAAEHLGRGLAVGDLDNDGRLDAVVCALDEPLVYLHNGTSGGHFLSIQLEGTASNRDGVGARATVVSAGLRQVAQRTGGGSYQSSNGGRLHFGLGSARRVDALEVRWPSGRVDRHAGLAVDAAYRLREGDPDLKPLMSRRGRRDDLPPVLDRD